MSDCFLCCSFKTLLRLVLFSLFLVKSWRRLCSGWSGILFTFSPCVRSLAFLLKSRGSTPAVFCIVAMSVLFIAPSMVLRPMLFTWSSLFVWVLAVVAHARAPYSSVGRTLPVYTVFRMRCDTPSVYQRAASVGLGYGCPFFSLTQYVVSMRGGSLVWLLRRLVAQPVVVLYRLA